MKEDWDRRGYYSSRIPVRDDIKLKSVLKSDNPNQHWALTGTALCLGGISGCIGIRNHLLQQKHYQWLEKVKTSSFRLWTEEKSIRDLTQFKRQLSTQLWADIEAALDNQKRVEAGLTNTERLAQEQELQDELVNKAHHLQLSQLDKQTEEALRDAAKARAERLKIEKKSNNEEEEEYDPKQEIIDKLKEHEGGWLWEIISGIKPLYIIGDQGSYKSYSAAAIALLRQFLRGYKLTAIIDPHFHQNKSKAWEKLLALKPQAYGANQNWEEVNQGIDHTLQRWNTRTLDDPVICSIFDEMTNYSLHEECEKLAAELNRRILSDPRKSNEGVIVIAHGFTNATTGGTSGVAKSRESGTLQLELKSNNQMQPLFKGVLNGFKDENGNLIKDMEITLPEWFRPEEIYTTLWGEELEENSEVQDPWAEDWEEEIKRWAQNRDREPAPTEIKEKFKQLTGQTLNEEGVQDILKLLR